ncbi:helix-turn-helix transcriptional regulator [Actinomadura rubrisoli]|uniref:XRE family transcriptional regulator n=1 Tax=Actinomadura rubrisoli TaxID=2530368 RepID=A0A4R5C4K9_9ACTN|nr:helix-turn-helix transcriptional regulator [Actinomadura rubrisoli]TDD91844.1 XRE family transcriptional regulator [Actinomadura rubrisoli]
MSAEKPHRSLADKINWLICHMWPADGAQQPSDAEVAAAVQGATNEVISRSTVWKLRTGRQPNPTLRTLNAFATFFKVPIGYFGDGEEAERIEGQLSLLALMRDGGIGNATLRALADLSPEGRQMITEIITSAARMEQQRSGRPPGGQDDR